MPSYRDQIPEDVFSVSFVIVPDADDESGSSFAFQEQDQVKVGPAATQQGGCKWCVCVGGDWLIAFLKLSLYDAFHAMAVFVCFCERVGVSDDLLFLSGWVGVVRVVLALTSRANIFEIAGFVCGYSMVASWWHLVTGYVTGVGEPVFFFFF